MGTVASWASVRIEQKGHKAQGTAGVALADSFVVEGVKGSVEVVDVKLDTTGQVERFKVADVRVL